MELKEFVTNTLVSIVSGIKAAQETGDVGGCIAPSRIGHHQFPKDSGVSHDELIVSTAVKFDVAVTVETTKAGKGGASARISVLPIGLDVGGTISRTNTDVSRLQFSVPLVMPDNKKAWHAQQK
jgi:hypothetical protein